MMPKKILLLSILTVLTVIGMMLQTQDSPALTRYLLLLNTTIILFICTWVGVDSARTFTFKSAFGKSLFYISIGLLSWGLGNLVWFFYNISGSEVPYPSLADIGYLGTIPFAAYGLFLLLKSVKVKLDAKTVAKVIIPPLLVFLVIFPIFIYEKLFEEVPMLTKILNVVYPLGDVVFLSFALAILTITYGSMLFKSLGIISLGFIIEAVADFAFSYTTSIGAYYTASWVDIIFTIAFFTIGFGMYHMSKSMKEVAKK
ncbi:MAG: hypothetical protein NTU57_00540 [Candidatus Aenigmarchaeota archaeon]|nr:hypothetical protein [Candidatus Aenigmarchaeota archaeon]